MITGPSSSGIRSAVIDVAASVFELPAAELAADASPETVDNWDSLNHLKLITAVETAFGIRLPMTRVLEIDTIEALICAVEDLMQ